MRRRLFSSVCFVGDGEKLIVPTICALQRFYQPGFSTRGDIHFSWMTWSSIVQWFHKFVDKLQYVAKLHRHSTMLPGERLIEWWNTTHSTVWHPNDTINTPSLFRSAARVASWFGAFVSGTGRPAITAKKKKSQAYQPSNRVRTITHRDAQKTIPTRYPKNMATLKTQWTKTLLLW